MHFHSPPHPDSRTSRHAMADFRQRPLVCCLAIALPALASSQTFAAPVPDPWPAYRDCPALHGLPSWRPACDRLPDELRSVVDQVMARGGPEGFFPAGHARRSPGQPPDRPAATIPVTTCSDIGPGSIREAFENAVSGDVIDLSDLVCSTITLTNGTLIADVEDLTLTGPGSDRLAISGNNAVTVVVHAGSKEAVGTLSVSGLTVRSGKNQYGTPGGCGYAYGDLVLDDVNIESCQARRVAGVSVRGSLTMSASRIANTHSLTDNYLTFGGAALVYGGATITDSIIEGNSVKTTSTIGGAMAGGIRVQGGPATIVRSKFLNNTVEGNIVVSGGAFWGQGHPVTIVDSLFDGNSLITENTQVLSLKVGGALAILDGDLTVRSTTISNNVAAHGFGAGFHVEQYYNPDYRPVIRIENSTVSNNVATWGGAGLQFWATDGFSVRNSTVSENTVESSYLFEETGLNLVGSGGVWYHATDDGGNGIVVTSSILHGNVNLAEPAHADLAAHVGDPGQPPEATSVGGGHSLVGAAAPELQLPADTLSLDPQLLPLADNGGPTPTHGLSEDSPAIDAGNAGTLSFDQRGEGFPRVVGASADIGAIEWTPEAIFDRIFFDGFEAGPE